MVDPLVRKDGKCALPGCTKDLPERAVTERDPFHSSICARRFHGVAFSSDERAPHPRRSMNL